MSLDNTPLPSQGAIDAGMATLESDVAEMFDISSADGPAVQGGETSGGVSPAPAPASSEPAGGEGVSGSPASPAEPSPAAPAATPASATPSEQPAPGTPPAAEPPAAAPSATPSEPPKPDEGALKLQSLEATVEALQAELAAARANPAPPAPAGEPGTESGRPELPAYSLTLPQPIAEAILDTENPQRQAAGITHMMNSLATIVHHNVRLEMRATIGSLLRAAQEQEQTVTRSTEVEQGRKQYYEAFPQHQNELIVPLIQAEARQMAAEFPNLKWGPDYINALGTRVNARIAALSGNAAPAVTTPPAAPAASIPAGSRAETPGTPLEGGDLIFDTFS